MKTQWITWLTAWAWLMHGLMAGPRDNEWKRVQDALSKGLPKTAITNLEPILSAALRDKAWAEATKALAQRVTLQAQIEGNKPEEAIPRLEAELARVPKEMQPVLQTILGHWYWQYYQRNRWRFMQRSATTAPPGKDFTTWDLSRLFDEIDRHYTAALGDAKTLKQTPIAQWEDLIPKSSAPDTLRPSLYDFLAHLALEFYSAGEQAKARPQSARDLSADSPFAGEIELFGTPNTFLSGNLEPRPDYSNDEKALVLWRDLLRFHRDDPDPAAFADADLGRLNWARNAAGGDTKAEKFRAALTALVERWKHLEVGARARAQLAELLQQEQDLVEAYRVASALPAAFKETPGGQRCRNLIRGLETPALSLSTEAVWPSKMEDLTLDISHKQLSQVHLRMVRQDWEKFLKKDWPRPNALRPEHWKQLLASQPERAWSISLPGTPDYKTRVEHAPVPSGLAPGFYFVIASAQPDFNQESQNVLSAASVWVSDLSVVVRPHQTGLEGFVVDATTGEPQPNAEVGGWWLDRTGNRLPTPTVQTDALGWFRISNLQPRPYILRAKLGIHAVSIEEGLFGGTPRPTTDLTQSTWIFTDRRLYRPGQIIRFKGLSIHVNRTANDYHALRQHEALVTLRDPNGREIARSKHQANDYGTFSGSFTAPTGGLLGECWLQVEGTAPGQAMIRVEEYKRPKFFAKLEAPKNAPKLNQPVTLSGRATAYTGAAIDHANVRYRVVRRVRWPWWCWWRMASGEEQEIAHGVTESAVDGTFQITFNARPDILSPAKDEPVFMFSVNADVTDNTGETRSDEFQLQVGYTALETKIQLSEWQVANSPVNITLETTSLDGIPEPTSGTLAVHELLPPSKVARAPLGHAHQPFPFRGLGQANQTNDASRLENWALGKRLNELAFKTGTNGRASVQTSLPTGAYKVILNSQDRYGRAVRSERVVEVLNPESTAYPIRVPNRLVAPSWSIEPGQEFKALWGTGYQSGRAYVEFTHRGQVISRFWTQPGRTQEQIVQSITETFRGGLGLQLTFIRENRAYTETRQIEVPWSNQEIELRWETFRSKLEPGQKESWTLLLSPKSTNASPSLPNPTELVAGLYDASLDQILPHAWPSLSAIFYQDSPLTGFVFANHLETFRQFGGRGWFVGSPVAEFRYRSLPAEILGPFGSFPYRRMVSRGAMNVAESMAMPTMAAPMMMDASAAGAVASSKSASTATAPAEESNTAKSIPPKLDAISARKNLQETAFFFPHLTPASDGSIRMDFTLPEALTEWRFLGFAHDTGLRSGQIEAHATTSKKIMVQPNPPRFLREGDTVEFSVKVSNQSEIPQRGRVRLTFKNSLNDQSADTALGNLAPESAFDIPAKESRGFSWRLQIPDGLGVLTYKVVAAGETTSDGEEGMVPVLSRRIYLTESLALPIRHAGTRTFEFPKLLASGKSHTLKQSSLTVQMVSQPAWYAVLALPYLMEFPHECSEQTFNRLYANSLARHIANSNPKIHRVFEQWRATPALDSPLQKNQDLKSVLIEETPWLRQAQNESAARRNIGILFDDNRLQEETTRTLEKLTQLQLPDGAWPWFPGGPANDYITLYIASGFGRLRQQGVDVTLDPAYRALGHLDNWLTRQYQEIQTRKRVEENNLTSTIALYLYGRSFFLKDRPLEGPTKDAANYFLTQARNYWVKSSQRQTQGHLALALHRFGDITTANAIVRSLKERAVSTEELGMFWRDAELSWWWYHAPIETHALMIEVFDEVAQDSKAVEDLKVWLIKQKQTQDWKTTKATADAVYALLVRGTNLLSSDALVEISLGGINVTPGKTTALKPNSPTPIEAGTGFYERRFESHEVKPAFGKIRVTKRDSGVSWGSVHWQYFEDVSKVTPHAGTPLRLKKQVFKRLLTEKGPVLEPLGTPVEPGDELVVRLELRTDRDMEYVHLKDQRGSGVEPIAALSAYRYQDGLAYYESPRDTANHFFIDYLPKGTYVFEYSTRVQLQGRYQTGIAEIQCMYAPEFNAHSESFWIDSRAK